MNHTHQSSATPDQPERSGNVSRDSSAKSDKARARKTSDTGSARAANGNGRLLAITVDADTARVVRIEGLDASGSRHELSTADREVLLTHATDGRVEDFVERAFEAGIACVLDDEPVPTANGESAEEAELRHQLLAPLIERSVVRHLMDRAVLDRAILSTLIDHAANQA